MSECSDQNSKGYSNGVDEKGGSGSRAAVVASAERKLQEIKRRRTQQETDRQEVYRIRGHEPDHILYSYAMESNSSGSWGITK